MNTSTTYNTHISEIMHYQLSKESGQQVYFSNDKPTYNYHKPCEQDRLAL